MIFKSKAAVLNRYGLCLLALFLVSLVSLAGCSSSDQSTRLRFSDFQQATDQMARSLTHSAFVMGRNTESPAAWVVVDKVQNLTSDIIPEAEQWMIVAQLQSALPLKAFVVNYNIHFQITPERFAMLRQAGFTGDLTAGPLTTHTLKAVFMDATRTDRQGHKGQVSSRSDFYYLEYTMVDVKTRQVVWSDRFEVKRQAKGLVID